jgi:hypothetical protein
LSAVVVTVLVSGLVLLPIREESTLKKKSFHLQITAFHMGESVELQDGILEIKSRNQAEPEVVILSCTGNGECPVEWRFNPSKVK